MERVTIAAFYIVLTAAALGLMWWLDSPRPSETSPTAVKQQTIQLEAKDFNESQHLMDAIHNLSQPVKQPSSASSLDQLQPASTNQQSGR